MHFSDGFEIPPSPSPADLIRLIRLGFGLKKFAPPALPECASEVLALTKSSSPDLVAIADIIENDMLLASQLIRIVNSPLYSRGLEILSVSQAVNRLGLETLQQIVLEASLNTFVYSHPSYAQTMNDLRCHCSATAQISAIIAKRVGYPSKLAFLCGLFHDIGLAAEVLLLGEAYKEQPPALDQIWGKLIEIHEQVAWHVMIQWNLPTNIREVVRYHHSIPDSARDPKGSSIVCLADLMAAEEELRKTLAGFRSSSIDITEGTTSDEDCARALGLLSLTDNDYEDLTIEVRMTTDKVKEGER